jgi:hypothetical protein
VTGPELCPKCGRARRPDERLPKWIEHIALCTAKKTSAGGAAGLLRAAADRLDRYAAEAGDRD